MFNLVLYDFDQVCFESSVISVYFKVIQYGETGILDHHIEEKFFISPSILKVMSPAGASEFFVGFGIAHFDQQKNNLNVLCSPVAYTRQEFDLINQDLDQYGNYCLNNFNKVN